MTLPSKRRGEASATLTQTLALIAGCFGLLAVTAFAADPQWWSSPGTGTRSAIVAPQVVTNAGVVTTNFLPAPYDVVTQGQLKQFTARAVDELNAHLSGGAGTNLNSMVSNWAQDYATNGYSAAHPKPSDYTAMTAGQLKYVGSNVWTRLVEGGYTNAVPAWLVPGGTDNQLAALGQLKEVFNFDLGGSSGSGAAAPTFSPGGGTYAAAQTVTVTCKRKWLQRIASHHSQGWRRNA